MANAVTDIDHTLLDSFLERAKNVTSNDYNELLADIAEHTTAGILNDIERETILRALADNKAVEAGKRSFSNALKKIERDINPAQVKGAVYGGHGIYRLADDGVYKIVEGDDADIRICSAVKVLAETRTHGGDNWGRLLEWQDNDGNSHRWAMPMTMTVGDGAELLRLLSSRGLLMRSGNNRHVIDYLTAVKTDSRLYSTDKTGWHNQTYVTPDQAYGTDEYIYQSDAAVQVLMSSRGTLQEWQEHIAKLATGNSRCVFAISSAFSGALLEPANVDGGGFHFHGHSSDGKSTAQLLAASVWGKPSDYAQTWRATGNGLEGIAAIHNDNLLVLDEIGENDSKRLGDIIYMLANGQGRTRSNVKGQAKTVQKWRVLLLSSGELTLADMMQRDGQHVKTGQELRLVNIPSNAGAGMGVFESIHQANSPAQFANTLRDAITRYYGTAGDAWLNAITQNPEWRDNLHDSISQFVAQVANGCHAQAQRVARRFAVVAQAGEMATQAGITGWQAGEATQAAVSCFNAWLDGFGSGNREHYNILQAVRAFVDSQASRFEDADQMKMDNHKSPHNRVGFKRWVGDTEPELWVLTSQWAELAPGHSASNIKQALFDAGWIKSTQGENTKIGGNGARKFQLFMPDGATNV